ncbi:MAG: aspartate aminotransferase family protein [Candidatus Omnitrophica bacterium]|nr:aspartate aminotransferase family protein [Candidatus Omnitrophota bacterium]
MKTRNVEELYKEYILPTYRQIPVCLVKGKGSRVWDLEGKEYLDFFPGWGVSGLGHCHPAVVSALKDQSRRMLHISNNYLNVKQARLAEEIVKNSFPGKVFFANSGAEANEAAIKFARKFGHAEGRFEIISMTNSFHGRTLAAITATGQPKYQAGFDPLPAGFHHVPLNDFDALLARVNAKTVAVMLELIQGEGGINIAGADFVRKLRKLCDEKRILLIVDEVQTGLGRTGRIFDYQTYGIEPDLMTLAKSLGSGVPIGALVVSNRVAGDVFTPGTHASTYGGNPLVCAAALAVFKTIRKERLLRNVEVMGAKLRDKLEALKAKYPCIQEVRGRGLMIGVELSVPGGPVADRARELGLLINCTQDRVLRIMPAINVTSTLIQKAMRILDRAFAETVKS